MGKERKLRRKSPEPLPGQPLDEWADIPPEDLIGHILSEQTVKSPKENPSLRIVPRTKRRDMLD